MMQFWLLHFQVYILVPLFHFHQYFRQFHHQFRLFLVFQFRLLDYRLGFRRQTELTLVL